MRYAHSVIQGFARIAILATVFCFSNNACAQIAVSDTNTFLNALDKAKRGEVVTLAPGIYEISETKIYKTVHLRGSAGTVLRANRPTPKGILVPLSGVSLTVENIRFEGARSPDRNGAGIRHEGKDLILKNVVFADNENGVLATGQDNGKITIENSKFLRNGHGDGYSHGIYVVRAKALTIHGSEFTGTKIGHHVKSLAKKTTITDTHFDEADGRTSYAIDASKGGALEITGNVFIQTAYADNSAIINYDTTRGGKTHDVILRNNKVTNAHPRGLFFRNDTKGEINAADNTITNIANGRMKNIVQAKIWDAPAESSSAVPDNMPALQMPPVETTPNANLPMLETLADRKPKRAFVWRAPRFDPAPEALAQFRLENNWKEDAEPDVFTFGQSFPEGRLKPGTFIAARFKGKTFDAQIDVLARHKDGSVRHGAVTIATPALSSGDKIDGVLISYDGEIHDNGTPTSFDASAILQNNFSFPMAMRHFLGDGSPRETIIDVRSLAEDAFASSNNVWLDGALVKEVRFVHQVADHLLLKFDLRVYRDGDIRTSVIFSNEKSFAPGSRDLLYDVVIGKAFKAEQIAHHRSSNWRRIFWAGRQPRLHIIQNPTDWEDAYTAPSIDTSAGVDTALTATRLRKLRNTRPLSPATFVKYFPTTGARPEIGLTPQWTAHFLSVQSEQTKQVMLANAEAAGAVPWHFADDKTGNPVSILDYPKFWGEERGLKAEFRPDRPHEDIFSSSDNGWSPDHAHKPALTALPYLVTADRYYADELAMQAAFAIFGRWPAYREGGLKVIDVGQVRASAWSLRDLSDGAYLLPDNHPSKAYLERALHENLSLMARKYVDQRELQSAGELEGYFEENIEREAERISPWQNDFLILSLAMTAKRGDANATRLLNWASGFHNARLLSPTFARSRATAYSFPAKHAKTQNPVTSWAQLEAKMQARDGAAPARYEGFKDLGSGYIAGAGAALGALYSQSGDPQTGDALRILLLETKSYPLWDHQTRGGVRQNGQFQFKLKAPNHRKYQRSQLRFGNGGDGDDMILANGAKRTVTGGDGDDVIFAPSANVTLHGGQGDDVLSGGSVMIGGTGRDVFSIPMYDGSSVIIKDFEPGIDKIVTPSQMSRSSLIIEPHELGAKVSDSSGRAEIFVQNVTSEKLQKSLDFSDK